MGASAIAQILFGVLVPFQLFEANSFLRREEAAGRYGQRVFGRI